MLCLSVDDRFIISGSEDKTLSVYDKRAAQVYKTVKVCSVYLYHLLIFILSDIPSLPGKSKFNLN